MLSLSIDIHLSVLPSSPSQHGAQKHGNLSCYFVAVELRNQWDFLAKFILKMMS
jgi:hypothetical protein